MVNPRRIWWISHNETACSCGPLRSNKVLVDKSLHSSIHRKSLFQCLIPLGLRLLRMAFSLRLNRQISRYTNHLRPLVPLRVRPWVLNRIFLHSFCGSKVGELSESYFTPTAADLKAAQATLTARTQALVNTPLQLRGTREATEKAKRDRWPNVSSCPLSC